MAAFYKVMGQLGLDGSGFFRTVTAAQTSIQRLNVSMGRALSGRMAGIFSVGAIGLAVRKTTEYAGKLVDLNSRTGVAIEDLQRFDRALAENGSTLEDLVSFWERLDRARNAALTNPKSQQAQAFQALGVTNLQQTNADMTRQIALKFQGSINPEPMIAALQAVGGRGVGNLVAAFRAGLDQMYQDITVMTTEQAVVLDELDDKFSTLGTIVAVSLAPALVAIINPIREVVFFFARLGEAFAGLGRIVGEFIGGFFGGSTMDETFDAIKNVHQTNTERMKALYAQQEELRVKQESDIKRNVADRTRKREGLKFDPFSQEKQQYATIKTPNDALVKVGNFLGTGNATMQTAALRQTQLQMQIAANTKETADKLDKIGGTNIDLAFSD